MTTPHRYRIIPPDGLPSLGINYSRSQLWRRVKEGTFPQPVRLGRNRIGFIETELNDWIESLIAERAPRRRARDPQ